MLLSCKNNRSSQGVALVMVLVLTAVILTILTGVTALVSHENYSSARTQAWHECIPVAEAGIEEAMSLMKNDGSSWGWTNNLATNGWSSMVSGVTTLTRKLDGANYFVASIDVSTGYPKIDSTGYVFFPNAQGGAGYLSRKVEIVSSASNTRMSMGLICSNAISLSGNGLIDSFDSSTNTKSTGGNYDPAKASDNVTVATGSTANNAIEANGSCCIWGWLKVGPGGGTSMIGTSRGGSKAYVGSGAWPPGVEPSRFTDGFIFNYPGVTPLPVPAAGGLPATYTGLPTKKIGGVTYTVCDDSTLGGYGFFHFASFGANGGNLNPCFIDASKGAVTNVVDGDFGTGANGYMVISNGTVAVFANNIIMDGGPPKINGDYSIIIGPNCKVLMCVANNFTLTASGRLFIDPTSTLTIYAGKSINLSGAGIINAATAKNLSLYGLPTCTDITVTASANFIGTIYAPSADVTISGNSPYYGSCICRSATFQGSGRFHFDEALYTAGGSSSAYFFNGWREVAP